MQRAGGTQQEQSTRVGLPTQQAAIIGKLRPGGVMAVGSPGHEDLLRSPQRGIQVRQPVCCEPRKFQVRVTDTYSAPIPKVSNAKRQHNSLKIQRRYCMCKKLNSLRSQVLTIWRLQMPNEMKQEMKLPSRLTSAT
ncbi:hypothetical protein GCK72_022570 [Caenorhabditis remanei]|uniref:Uncharacterized protein n=1 Tax=Caenorhabditis remanei TaxID=31234 RepID=A0A6A5FU29_CAERE|nr:hypothetical protein GCK72_022570 [Caenorhabditis remanei]KAF1746118.1 hypothetical protein GCK72_022570 [Caenorhabditis remanei]